MRARVAAACLQIVQELLVEAGVFAVAVDVALACVISPRAGVACGFESSHIGASECIANREYDIIPGVLEWNVELPELINPSKT